MTIFSLNAKRGPYSKTNGMLFSDRARAHKNWAHESPLRLYHIALSHWQVHQIQHRETKLYYGKMEKNINTYPRALLKVRSTLEPQLLVPHGNATLNAPYSAWEKRKDSTRLRDRFPQSPANELSLLSCDDSSPLYINYTMSPPLHPISVQQLPSPVRWLVINRSPLLISTRWFGESNRKFLFCID